MLGHHLGLVPVRHRSVEVLRRHAVVAELVWSRGVRAEGVLVFAFWVSLAASWFLVLEVLGFWVVLVRVGVVGVLLGGVVGVSIVGVVSLVSVIALVLGSALVVFGFCIEGGPGFGVSGDDGLVEVLFSFELDYRDFEGPVFVGHVFGLEGFKSSFLVDELDKAELSALLGLVVVHHVALQDRTELREALFKVVLVEVRSDLAYVDLLLSSALVLRLYALLASERVHVDDPSEEVMLL